MTKLLEVPCDFKAVKILDAESRRIAGYATVWGELDCQRDIMTKEAIVPYLGKSLPLMLYRHGLDPEFGSAPPGNWLVVKADNVGLWVEGEIFKNPIGDQIWNRLEKENNVAMSVGSVWYLVKKQLQGDGTKRITDWPPFEISIMEKGQCVPSARSSIKSQPLFNEFSQLALKMGVEFPEKLFESVEGQNDDAPNNIDGGHKDMSEIDVEALLGSDALVSALDSFWDKKEKERLAQAEAEAELEAEVEAKAVELVNDQLPSLVEKITAEITGEIEAKWEEQIEQQKKEYEQQLVSLKERQLAARQPDAPLGFRSDGSYRPDIRVGSRYDRLSLQDALLRYMVMKSLPSTAPSEEFYRALAHKADDFMEEKDIIYDRNGRKREVPALDWEAVIPPSLSIEEVPSEVMQIKGEFARASSDPMQDPVSELGVKQLYWLARNSLAIKANELTYSTQANSGDEWVPTLMSAVLWRDIRLAANVLPLFDQFDMPSQPYDQPIESTDPVAYSVAETTNEAQLILTGGPFTDSKLGTAKVTYTAGKLGLMSYWSEEMQEDSIINFEPQIRDQYGIAMAHSLDDIILNGDESTGTANISYDGASIAAASRFLVLDGLRHEAKVTTTTDAFSVGGPLNIQTFIDSRVKMGTNGIYGINPANLVYLMDAPTYYEAIGLDEVLTLDKMGSAATIVNGQLGSVFNIPIVVPQDYSLTAADGNIDSTPGNNTLGSFLCVNKRGWRVGWRRRPRLTVVRLPGSDARYIVMSARIDIRPFKAGMASLAYNITVTT